MLVDAFNYLPCILSFGEWYGFETVYWCLNILCRCLRDTILIWSADFSRDWRVREVRFSFNAAVSTCEGIGREFVKPVCISTIRSLNTELLHSKDIAARSSGCRSNRTLSCRVSAIVLALV